MPDLYGKSEVKLDFRILPLDKAERILMQGLVEELKAELLSEFTELPPEVDLRSVAREKLVKLAMKFRETNNTFYQKVIESQKVSIKK